MLFDVFQMKEDVFPGRSEIFVRHPPLDAIFLLEFFDDARFEMRSLAEEMDGVFNSSDDLLLGARSELPVNPGLILHCHVKVFHATSLRHDIESNKKKGR